MAYIPEREFDWGESYNIPDVDPVNRGRRRGGERSASFRQAIEESRERETDRPDTQDVETDPSDDPVNRG